MLVVQSVEASPSFCTALDEAGVAQHPEMLGHLRLRETQHVDELPDRPLPRHQRVQDLATVDLGYRVEDVRGGRGACHRAIEPSSHRAIEPSYSDIGICQGVVASLEKYVAASARRRLGFVRSASEPRVSRGRSDPLLLCDCERVLVTPGGADDTSDGEARFAMAKQKRSCPRLAKSRAQEA
jgi:hypothetical protein